MRTGRDGRDQATGRRFGRTFPFGAVVQGAHGLRPPATIHDAKRSHRWAPLPRVYLP
jgi:hypothetical protein